MSLVQHVTSIEGTDRIEPNYPEDIFLLQSHEGHFNYGATDQGHHALRPQQSLRHVLSYDALPKPEPTDQVENLTKGVTPYKVSVSRRLAQVCFTVLSCWFASGIVFGFAALKPILVEHGLYRELCTTRELEANVEVCYKQDNRLNLFFAVASTVSNISALPVGTILDRYGARICAILGSASLAFGSILMALAFRIPEFDGYIIGNVFLALGGTFIFVPSFSIANSFPRFAGTIVATITGAFDASAAVFLFFRLAYEASKGVLSPEKFFFGYISVPILILIAQFTLMNEDAYKTGPQLEWKIDREQDTTRDVHDSDGDLSEGEVKQLRSRRRDKRASKLSELDKLLGDSDERRARAEKDEDRLTVSGVWGVLHGKSALQQVLTPWFILIALLTVLQMLRMNFFIATIRAQYDAMLENKVLGRKVNSFFDIALPVGGVIATPFIGSLLDNLRTAYMLAILVALITVVGIAGSLPFLWAGYLNVMLFVLLRPLYYSAMSDYATKVFGFATFGRVYGCIIALSGLVNLSQPLIDMVNHDIFHDNPIPINIVLAGLGLCIGIILVCFVWSQDRTLRQQEHESMVEWGREYVIIEEDEEQ